MSASYSVLECFSPPGLERAVIEYPAGFKPTAWLSGARLEPRPAPPIEFHWAAASERAEGAEGAEGAEAGAKLAYYGAGPVLMRKELVAALREAGVDNFEAYAAVLRSHAGRPDDTDYLAVNVLGLVQAVDHAASVVADSPFSGPLLDLDIESLVVDETRTRGLDMFRLAECITAVLVSERVQRHLEARGGFGLTFVAPADFSG